MEKKFSQWTAEEIKCMFGVWISKDFQERLENTSRKRELYAELSEEMAKSGFNRTPEQIINKIKKLKKEYRDGKKDVGKNGAARGVTCLSLELLGSVMSHRPGNQVTGWLNSVTAADTTGEEADRVPPPTPGSSVHEDGSFEYTIKEPSISRQDDEDTSSDDSEERGIPDQRKTIRTRKRRRVHKLDVLLAYLKEADQKAEEREERMMRQQEQSSTALLRLVERMVSAIEDASKQN
ncbi:uncharacterized protein si:dkey-261j15.2 [Melanotaenia boesemani]|uniref:uncharacterized protein si:dkey-261j15.2 n=1 Tax=Melanotaenia boesemani TaxID=1250792 RepID=UPI001C046D65|nr:uncharacterized protein si:dkey-261j15.2 [Melanotaenia boesemani]